MSDTTNNEILKLDDRVQLKRWQFLIQGINVPPTSKTLSRRLNELDLLGALLSAFNYNISIVSARQLFEDLRSYEDSYEDQCPGTKVEGFTSAEKSCELLLQYKTQGLNILIGQIALAEKGGLCSDVTSCNVTLAGNIFSPIFMCT